MRRPNLLLVATLALASCSSGGTKSNGGVTPSFTVSGVVSGAVAAGVTVSLGGAAAASAVTDGSGRYSFGALPNGSYTVTPSLTGYTFGPATRTVLVNGADAGGQDFTATAVTSTYAVSGTVRGAVAAGVTITVSGAGTDATLTVTDGSYTFTSLPKGTYTLTPSLVGYTFGPASRTVVVNGVDLGAQDFTATAVTTTHTVSGSVSGGVAAGVTVTLGGPATASAVTDATGKYSFGGLPNGSYTVAPSATGYAFAPASRTVVVNGAGIGGQDFTATAFTSTHTVSGRVSGAVAAGVTMTVTGASTGATFTGADGSYAFTSLPSGSFTVTPSLAGYTFVPASRTIAVGGAGVTGQDFVATAVTHAISGYVSGAVAAGVTVMLGGGATASALTDASGKYSFDGLPNGSYTITPSRTSYTFAPASRTVVVNGADVAFQDFTATAVSSTYTVSGTVSGALAAGVTITVTGASTGATVTGGDGSYAFTSLPSGTYTLTPSLAGYTFEPASRTVVVNGADVGGQDFVATAVTYALSGTIGGAVAAGVTVTLGGGATGTTVTGGDGSYAFTSLPNGTYAVTPSLAGYSFTPANRVVVVNGSAVGGQNFTATAVPVTYTVAGTVTGAVAAGVTVSLGGVATRSTFTAADGSFAFTALRDGIYTVTPSRNGYAFDPPSRTVTIAGSDEVLEAFAARSWTPTWEVVPSGTSATLYAVWGSSPDDVWIVGAGPILHWDGSSLTNMPNPASHPLRGVWGAAPNDVWAVGELGIVHWDGTSWTIPPSASGVDIKLNGVWGSSATDIWAVGAEPWHYDGTVWSRGAFPKLKTDDEEYGMWGSGPNDVWAVGDNINRFDGRGWGMYLGDADMQAVWGPSSSEVWAVGRQIARYDGHTWSGVADPLTQRGLTPMLQAVWGSSSSDVWSVGGGDVLHWDGSRWSEAQASISPMAPLWGVWGSSGYDVWMVGGNGTIVRYR